MQNDFKSPGIERLKLSVNVSHLSLFFSLSLECLWSCVLLVGSCFTKPSNQAVFSTTVSIQIFFFATIVAWDDGKSKIFQFFFSLRKRPRAESDRGSISSETAPSSDSDSLTTTSSFSSLQTSVLAMTLWLCSLKSPFHEHRGFVSH